MIIRTLMITNANMMALVRFNIASTPFYFHLIFLFIQIVPKVLASVMPMSSTALRGTTSFGLTM